MATRMFLAWSLAVCLLLAALFSSPTPACCPAPPSGKPVVNADQTVIIVWDAANKTEHFIRQASFKSEADDFGFLVPSPSEPELAESGNDAFPYLATVTAPEVQKVSRPSPGVSCGCGAQLAPQAGRALPMADVNVLQEKVVAGFHAVVLETKSADDLVAWLKDHGYAYSPEVAAWAKPYVEQGWKITALKVAKDKDATEAKSVATAALRMSFKTDRPLFPYREPDPKESASALNAKHRLLRIFLLADARYQGELTKETPWTGAVAWANQLKAEERKNLLEKLNLQQTTGPADCWLTEFEDDWPYRAAPGDVYFSRADDQSSVKRPPIIQYVSTHFPTDVAGFALAAALVVPPLMRRFGRAKRKKGQ
jgi:hypothetical protein